jgi:crossover junction endodeoxyribonuclease RusA
VGATFSVFVAGRPITQGSMRSLGKGRMTHDNPRLRAWRKAIGWTVRASLGAAVLDPAARVTVRCHFLCRPQRPRAPDLDKLVRAVLDALTHIAYVDDSQVVTIDARRTMALHASDERLFVAEGQRLVPNAPWDDPEGLLLTVETT